MGLPKRDTDSDEETPSSSGEEEEPNSVSWVCCDLCSKWRRIPAALAQQLRDDEPWTCSQNPDKAVASCDVPQELTDEQIDAIQEGADGDEDADDARLLEERARRRRIPAAWQLISDNVMTHRKRKVQDEDDVMICNCKPHWRGGDGCGPDCINRMLCVECVAGFCPSEDRCTNQAFTKKQYAKIEVRRAGPKGFGLFALEHIHAGQFIIEYIGEVLEEEEYLRRKDFYAEVGQRHYYFMNIGNGEVIDACRKGNRARFINHSCDPNCETQKWLARGELAIGLFATKDIAVGEELTFDYNFERYGDKPMPCYCGSRTCRRFIGGTQDTYDESMVFVEPEDVTNDFQPVMLVDADMDWAMKALLDWRVGVQWEKDKEATILGRLEKVCKGRKVPWTPAHFHGMAQAPIPDSDEALVEPDSSAATKTTATRTRAPVKKGKDSVKDSTAGKDSATPAAGGRKTRASRDAKESGTDLVPGLSAVKVEDDSEAGAGDDESKAALRAQLKAQYKAKAKEQEVKTEGGSPKTGPATTGRILGAGRRRGAASASVKTDTSLLSSITGADKEGGLCTVKEEPTRGRDTDREGREAQSKGLLGRGGSGSASGKKRAWAVSQRVKRRSEIDRRLENLTGPSGRMKDASKQNIIKVLRMFNLCDIGPTRVALRPVQYDTPAADAPATDAAGAGADGAAAGALPGPPPPPGAPTGHDADALSAVNASNAAAGAQPGAAQGSAPMATDGTPAAQGVVGTTAEPSGAGTGPLTDAPLTTRPSQQEGGPTTAALALAAQRVPSPALPPLGPGGRLQPPPPAPTLPLVPFVPTIMTARQRARMADLSLLLDVILKTSSATVRKDFVTCGVLNQLHQVIGRNFNSQYSVILRKVLRTIESLPITADDIYSVRTAHGNLADTLQELAGNQDYEVRNRAISLMKKFPPQACQDQALVQRPRRVATGFSPALPPGAQPPAGADAALSAPEGAGLPPIPPRQSRMMRPGLPRGFSAADIQGSLLSSVPASPALGQDSPLNPQGDGAAAGDGGEPAHKRRRRRGFSDAPPGFRGADPHARPGPHTPPVALGLMPGPGRPLLPYSYRHGSALLDHGRAGEPPPPPLDAEDLYEMLHVPEVVVRRAPGYASPAPPVRPVSVSDGSVHGERSDMEVIFAVGVYDTDWEEAAIAAAQARSAARSKHYSDTPASPKGPAAPLSPLNHQPTTSPTRPDREREESQAEKQRRAEYARHKHPHSHPHAHPHTHLPSHTQQEPRPQQTPAHAGQRPGGTPLDPNGGPMPAIMDLRMGAPRSMPPVMSLGGGPRSDSPGMLAMQGGGPGGPGHGLENFGPHSRFSQHPGGMGPHRGLPRHLMPPQSPMVAAGSPQLGSAGPTPAHRGNGPPAAPGPPASGHPTPNAQQQAEADAAEWARPMHSDYPESWNDPDDTFSDYVHETVRYRLGKYLTTPDHPNKITSKDAHHLLKKIHREVVEKERQAYKSRQAQNVSKIIERRKVENNIKEFVRLSIRRLHTQQAGGNA